MDEQHPDNPICRCVVCGQSLCIAATIPLCAEHFPAASRDQLLPMLADLRFRHREGHWLLFCADPRLRDVRFSTRWLALNIETGSIHHFPTMTEVAAWSDLLLTAEVPFTSAALLQHSASLMGQPSLPRLRELITPTLVVYGPIGTPYGLELTSFISSQPQGITSLIFTAQPSPSAATAQTEEKLNATRQDMEQSVVETPRFGPRVEGSLAAGDGSIPASVRHGSLVTTRVLQLNYARGLTYCRPLTAGYGGALFTQLPTRIREELGDDLCAYLCMQADDMLWRYAPDQREAIAASPVQSMVRSFTLAGQVSTGALLYWPQTNSLGAFQLEYSEIPPFVYQLSGAAYGLTLAQLEMLLDQLVLLNDRPDLLIQYQVEIEAQLTRLQATQL